MGLLGDREQLAVNNTNKQTLSCESNTFAHRLSSVTPLMNISVSTSMGLRCMYVSVLVYTIDGNAVWIITSIVTDRGDDSGLARAIFP